MKPGFAGFPKEGLAFFKQLKKNNNRDWFQPRKEIFDRSLKAPMEELVEAINARLVAFAPQFLTEPKKAIYRIYRDTRFSNDKTPYKTHLAASFNRAGMDRHISAGYYFSVGADQIEVAAGIYMPGPDELRAVREFLMENHERMHALCANKTLVKLVGPLRGDQLTRTPKGFPVGHVADDLIRRKQYYFYDTRLDADLAATPKILAEVVKRFEALAPFVDFMNEPLIGRKKKDPLTMERSFGGHE